MQAIIEPGMYEIHKDFVFQILQTIHPCEIGLLSNIELNFISVTTYKQLHKHSHEYKM